ncbi:Uncharacterized protein DAT39_021697 [Clarias magur]|uniref:Uncharacterized protein n=1 Tax=Clarias magur TaxID=1594786 RepID=A0A8J4T4U9_CLAMG|nr:Uncharacterized protein DAT39_021697 [Clarias magur]
MAAHLEDVHNLQVLTLHPVIQLSRTSRNTSPDLTCVITSIESAPDNTNNRRGSRKRRGYTPVMANMSQNLREDDTEVNKGEQ